MAEQCCIIFSFGSHSTSFMVQPIFSNKRYLFSLERTAHLHAAPNVLSVYDTCMLSHDHQLFFDCTTVHDPIDINYLITLTVID